MVCSMQEQTQHRDMDVAISTESVFACICLKNLCFAEIYYQLEHHLVNTSGKLACVKLCAHFVPYK